MSELNKEFYDKLREMIKPYFEGTNTCHDFDHVERVYNLALQLSEKDEEINKDIVKLAVLLHDIARKEQDKSKGKICHVSRGAEIAKEILEGLKIKEELVKEVIHCIETHSFRKDNFPKTKEARILYDADKLDSIGAIGILRSASFGGSVGARIHNPEIKPSFKTCYTKQDSAYHEYVIKLSKIKNKMLTKEGKKIAEQRHDYMKNFFNRANKELKGEI